MDPSGERLGQEGEEPALTLARHDDLLLAVQVVLVALGVAAAALEGRRRPEHVPQGPGAGLAAGREVVQGHDELVTLVADEGGPLAVSRRRRRRLRTRLLLTLDLALVGVQDLGGERVNNK